MTKRLALERLLDAPPCGLLLLATKLCRATFDELMRNADAVLTNRVGLDSVNMIPESGRGGAGLSPLTAPLGAGIGAPIGVMINRK